MLLVLGPSGPELHMLNRGHYPQLVTAKDFPRPFGVLYPGWGFRYVRHIWKVQRCGRGDPDQCDGSVTTL